MYMKKIIFLDFDGVLNTEHNQNMLVYHGKAWKDKHGAFFDPEAVAQLERIIVETGADIVIESSWKYLGWRQCSKCGRTGICLAMLLT